MFKFERRKNSKLPNILGSSSGFRVIFRVLIVVLLLIAGSFAKPKNDPSSMCPEESAEITAWLFADARCAYTVEHQIYLIETFHKLKWALDTIPRKALLYKVCTKKMDGDTLFYPCSLESSALTSILKNLNVKDSRKGMESKVKHIFYASGMLATDSAFGEVPLQSNNQVHDYNNRDRDFVYEHDFIFYRWDRGPKPTFSNLYLNDDGSYEALCASADGKNCDFLYASVEIGNKMIPRNKLWSKTWGRRQFEVPVEKNLKVADLNQVLDNIYDRSFSKPLNKTARDSLISFEMCYKDSIGTPCNMNPAVIDSVRKIIEGRGDAIKMFTHQHFSWTEHQFFLGSVVNKHQCISSDGKFCDDLYVLVRWNDSYMKKAKSLSSSIGVYRFKLKDYSFVAFHSWFSDVIDTEKLMIYKKNGIRVGK